MAKRIKTKYFLFMKVQWSESLCAQQGYVSRFYTKRKLVEQINYIFGVVVRVPHLDTNWCLFQNNYLRKDFSGNVSLTLTRVLLAIKFHQRHKIKINGSNTNRKKTWKHFSLNLNSNQKPILRNLMKTREKINLWKLFHVLFRSVNGWHLSQTFVGLSI